MALQTVRDFIAKAAPDLEIVETPEAHTTEFISREWKVLPAQVAKTLTMRIGDDVVIAVTCGDSRLENRKVKDELGGKPRMLPGEEASQLTGHPVGGITPLGMSAPLPVFFDEQLRQYDEVVTSAGSTHAAMRIAPERFASLVDARWVDICKDG